MATHHMSHADMLLNIAASRRYTSRMRYCRRDHKRSQNRV